MSGNKGKAEEIQINPKLEAASNRALARAEKVSKLPYRPNRGVTIAGFSPQQEAAMNATNQAAQSFGMAPTQGNYLPPQEVTADGFRGYSTGGLYDENLDASMSQKEQALYGAAIDPRRKSGGGKGGNVDIFSALNGGGM